MPEKKGIESTDILAVRCSMVGCWSIELPTGLSESELCLTPPPPNLPDLSHTILPSSLLA